MKTLNRRNPFDPRGISTLPIVEVPFDAYDDKVDVPITDLLVSGINMEGKSSFDVVIAYEDYATGAHAKHTYDHLLHTFGGNRQIGHTMWCFDALRISGLRQAAAEEAAQADLIIIAAWNRNDLPVEVKSWIEEWLTRKTTRLGALAALIENDVAGTPENTAVICGHLREVCWRGHMDFFSQTTDVTPLGRCLHAGSVSAMPGQVDFLHEEIWEDAETDPQWGINE